MNHAHDQQCFLSQKRKDTYQFRIPKFQSPLKLFEQNGMSLLACLIDLSGLLQNESRTRSTVFSMTKTSPKDSTSGLGIMLCPMRSQRCSMGFRFGDIAVQGRMSNPARLSRVQHARCGLTLSCWKTVLCTPYNKGRTTGSATCVT
ncbi:hypothetical protein TNCV_2136521 [Trichonephila clavipes]|nr:hypothetical protein TNCV_2136521 [Trichonephila clavipes]